MVDFWKFCAGFLVLATFSELLSEVVKGDELRVEIGSKIVSFSVQVARVSGELKFMKGRGVAEMEVVVVYSTDVEVSICEVTKIESDRSVSFNWKALSLEKQMILSFGDETLKKKK